MPRIRGRRLQRLRLAAFCAHPFCVHCHTRLAEERDHIVPLWAGGEDVETNTQMLCAACHARKTAAETRTMRR